MEKLQSTARKLDIFFRIVHIFITVALVASLVGMAIIGAYFLFDLSPAMIGTGYGSVELGFLDLEIADSVELSVDVIILGAAAELALGLLCLLTVSSFTRGFACIPWPPPRLSRRRAARTICCKESRRMTRSA